MKRNNNELRSLSRTALLELMVEQGREIDRLKEQIETQNEMIRSLLAEREQSVHTSDEGAIDPSLAALVAAAALKINEMLENARAVLGDKQS